MTKWFITGGEGFVGYHICKKLSIFGVDEIITYDSYNHYIPISDSSWPEYQRYRNEELDDIGVTRIRGDVNDRGLLKESLERHKPGKIVHLAALPIANVSNKYPYEAKRNILDTTLTLMDVLRDVSFEFDRVVYTSSSMVYGDFEKIPAEETDRCAPLGMYGSMKLAGEHVVRAYSKRFEIPYVIIRPSAVYGPTDCNRRVTEIFLTNALEGKPLRLDNGGDHMLDFTYVRDLAWGFVLAGEKQKAKFETFNMTRGEGRRIKDLAEIIKNLIPETKSFSQQRDVYRPNRGALDITKAKQLLGYNPEYSLEDGMSEYHQFVKDRGIA